MEISSTLIDYLAAIPASILDTVLSADPIVKITQYALGIVAAVLVALVFWATWDILRRTRSLIYQISCILLVAAVPFFGFFVYFFVRPSQTLLQKDLAKNVREILFRVKEMEEKQKKKMVKEKEVVEMKKTKKPFASKVSNTSITSNISSDTPIASETASPKELATTSA